MANMKTTQVLRNCIVTAIESRSWGNVFSYEERSSMVTSARKSRKLTMISEGSWLKDVCV